MQHRPGISLKAAALAVATLAAFATAAPSGAFARSPHKVHAASRAAPSADGQGSRYNSTTSNAYGAMQGGSSSPSFGYGVGDNSHGCAACVN